MEVILEVKNIEKTFNNNIRALRGANLTLEKGEIHAIVGENAAGKSTLMNVLYGMICPDNGEIFLNGKKCTINHPNDAIKYGIGMVHQHFKLVPDFNVLENIILGREKNYTNFFHKINYAEAKKDVEEILERLDIDLNLNERTDRLSIGLQSKVEIIKTLFKGAEIIILDEPTTVLAPTEVDSFLKFLKTLRDRGSTIIYISHRLKEIFDVSDSITVLSHGKTVTTLKTSETNMEEIASLMIGRELKGFEQPDPDKGKSIGQSILKLENVCVENGSTKLEKISFNIRQGEILGVAGIEGNGQVELADTLIGILKNNNGNVYFKDKLINGYSPAKRRECGMHYVPDDRILKGLALNMSINENAINGYQHSNIINKSKKFMDWSSSENFTKKIVIDYKVEGMNNPSDLVRNLSGGNMQKLIVGREMITDPPLIILSQPTVGVDFGSQSYIHEKIRELRRKGTAFLLISEDLDELMTLSDRIIVLYRGKVVKEFPSPDVFDEKVLGYYMTGVKGVEN